jgi:uncharacterized membrane protein YiaA
MRKFGIFIVFIFVFGTTNYSQNLDIDLLRKINLERNQALDPTYKFITNSVAPIGLGAPLIVTSLGFIQNDKSLNNKGYYLGATLLTSAVLTTTLKFAIDRDRPFVTYYLLKNTKLTIALVIGYGFLALLTLIQALKGKPLF